VAPVIAMHIKHWRDHFPMEGVWARAFHFLEALRADSPLQDRVVLDDEGTYARVMRYDTRMPDNAVLEAHDRYIDVQMSLVAGEEIAWYDRDTLRIKTPYDPQTDVVFFEHDATPLGRVRNTPFLCSVYFPEDPHMPQLPLDGIIAPVTKAVVKVPTTLARGKFAC